MPIVTRIVTWHTGTRRVMSAEVGPSVTAFVALLASAVMLSIAAERIRVPAAVLLVAAGAVAGSVWHLRPPFAFGPALLFVFLPPLVFEAAWNVDLAALRTKLGRIALLAFPGTLLTAFAVAGGLALTGALPLAAGLLLGAMVAATDPVAVVAVFRRVPVPVEVRTLVEAESLANDAVAVALYGVALTLANGGAVAWVPDAAHAVVALAGGIALGSLCAVPLWLVLRTTEAAEYEVTATVALAYAAYLLADRLQVSGIFATAAGAVALRALLARRAHMSNPEYVDTFWNAGAYLANAVVFLATGLLIDVPRALREPAVVLVALAVVGAARVLLALVAVPDLPGRITVFLAGMRGALPLALALALPQALPHRAEIVDGVFAIVLVTLVVQGAPLEPVVRRLYGARSGRVA
jgi:CPA1 family monovalent cation:H+ antiporter